jgi:hypothetical protein
MKRLVQIALIAVSLGLTGCAEPGYYPLSGEECQPNDPVMDLDASDCAVLSG